MTKDKKVQWHPAFYGAMHLELKENKGELEFIEELILNTLPLRVDMLVVKKKGTVLTVNRYEKLGFDKRQHHFLFFLRCMSRHMKICMPVVNYLCTLMEELVNNAADHCLIPGNC